MIISQITTPGGEGYERLPMSERGLTEIRIPVWVLFVIMIVELALLMQDLGRLGEREITEPLASLSLGRHHNPILPALCRYVNK